MPLDIEPASLGTGLKLFFIKLCHNFGRLSLSTDWKNFNTPDYASIKNILPSNPNGLDIADAVLNIRSKKLPDLKFFRMSVASL